MHPIYKAVDGTWLAICLDKDSSSQLEDDDELKELATQSGLFLTYYLRGRGLIADDKMVEPVSKSMLLVRKALLGPQNIKDDDSLLDAIDDALHMLRNIFSFRGLGSIKDHLDDLFVPEKNPVRPKPWPLPDELQYCWRRYPVLDPKYMATIDGHRVCIRHPCAAPGEEWLLPTVQATGYAYTYIEKLRKLMEERGHAEDLYALRPITRLLSGSLAHVSNDELVANTRHFFRLWLTEFEIRGLRHTIDDLAGAERSPTLKVASRTFRVD